MTSSHQLFFPVNLPSNILEQILSFLSCRDIFNLQLSCKACYEATLEVSIRWTLQLAIPLNLRSDYCVIPHNLPNHWESIAKFIVTLSNSPVWCVKKLVITYTLEGAIASCDENLSLILNSKLLSYLELFYNVNQYSLEIVFKDNRLSLYRGDPLRINVNMDNIMFFSDFCCAVQLRVAPGSYGVTYFCLLDKGDATAPVGSTEAGMIARSRALRKFSVTSSNIVCERHFMTNLLRNCPNLKTLKLPNFKHRATFDLV